MPDLDPAFAFSWLESRSTTHVRGTRLTLDERLRAALLTLLRYHRQTHYEDIRSRLADRTHDRMDSSPGPATPDAASRQDVVEALRSFHEPAVLISSPLGDGATGDEPIRLIRDRIRVAADEVFDEGELDRLRKGAVERGYLDAGSSHELAAASLHMSRATYFRRLAEGVDRIAGYLADDE